jgi:hypothetical protein
MPKGFRNINLNQRDPNRRLGGGPPPRPQQVGFRPSKEKNRPPGWGPTPPAEPAQAAEPEKPAAATNKKPEAPEKKK